MVYEGADEPVKFALNDIETALENNGYDAKDSGGDYTIALEEID